MLVPDGKILVTHRRTKTRIHFPGNEYPIINTSPRRGVFVNIPECAKNLEGEELEEFMKEYYLNNKDTMFLN